MTMNDRHPLPRLSLISILCTIMGIAACGPPRPDDDGASADDTPAPDLGNGDKWNCGELGLKCVGPMGFGECVDGQCQPILGSACSSPVLTPTCEAYCAHVGSSCVPGSCAGATAWGWEGDEETADIYCLDSYQMAAVPLDVACDEPLAGLATTLRCCCEFP